MAEDNVYRIGTVFDLAGFRVGLQQLRVELRAFDPSKDIDKKKLDKAFDSKSLNKYSESLKKVSKGYKGLNEQIDKAKKKTEQHTKATKGTANALGDVARRVFVWGALSAAIFGALQNLKDLFDFTIKVNSAMADLRKVLPQASDFEFLKKQTLQFSIDFGVEPLEAFDVLREFVKAGLDTEDALKATRTALLGINATGADTKQIFNALIGANRIFNIGFENSARIIDKVKKVDQAFAVDAKDLIDSITAIGPAVANLGGDIDDLFGLIATLGEAARVSGREAANSLKRILSRIVSQEGIRALERLGVTVFKSAGEFRKLRDILGDLAERLKTATQVEKQNIAVILAQVRQYSKFLALIQNFHRAQKATIDSSRSFGEAFIANQVALDTWEKQAQISENRMKRLGEELLSGGIVPGLTALKVSFGEVADILNNDLGRGFILATTGITILIAANSALKRALLGFTGIGAIASKQIGLFNIASTRTIKVVDEAGKKLKFTTGFFTRFAAGAAILIPVLIAAGLAYEAFTRKTRRRNRIIKATVEELKEFKRSLEDITFANIAASDVETKFNSIFSTFRKLEESAGANVITAKDLNEAYSKLFFGVPSSSLTIKQLEELQTRLESIRTVINEVRFRPFFDTIGQAAAKAVPILNKASAALGKPFEVLLTAETGLRGFVGVQTEAFTKFVNILRKFRQEVTGETPSISGFLASKEVAIDIIKITDNIVELTNKIKDLNETQKGARNLFEFAREDQVKKGASSILSLIDTTSLFTQALEDTNAAASQSFIFDRAEARSRAFSLISQEVIKELKRQAIAFAQTKEEELRFVQAIDKAKPAIDKMVDGLNSITLNTVSFLSGLKQTTAAVFSGFEAQTRALRVIGSLTVDFGKAFDFTKESLNSVDNTLRNLFGQIKNNEKALSTLRIEAKALEEAIRLSKGIPFSDTQQLPKIINDLESIKLRTLSLNDTNERNKRQLEEQVKQLLEYRQVLVGVTELEKLREKILEGQKNLTESVLQRLLKLNSLRIQNPFEELKENDKVFNRILETQLNYQDNLFKIGSQEETITNSKKNQLVIQENLNKSLRVLDTQLSRISTLQDGIKNSVDGVKGAFVDLLGSQDDFFDALQKRGSLIEVFRKTVSGIADVIARADAEIIAEKISKSSKGIFRDARSELQFLEESVEETIRNISTNPDVGLNISNSIVAGAKVAGDIFYDRIIDGSKFMEEVLAELPRLVIQSFEELKALRLATVSGGTASTTEDLSKGIQEGVKAGVAVLGDNAVEAVLLQESNKLMEDIAFKEINQLIGVNQKLDAMNKNLQVALISVSADDATRKAKSDRDFTNALTRRLGVMVAQSVASVIAKGTGAKPQDVAFASGLGAVVGGIAGGPQGAAIGQAAGALLGSLVGRKEKEEEQVKELQKIERNTAQLVDRLSPEILNAPANFTLPSGKSLRGGVSVSIGNISVAGGSSQDIANEIASAIEDSLDRTFSRRSVLD